VARTFAITGQNQSRCVYFFCLVNFYPQSGRTHKGLEAPQHYRETDASGLGGVVLRGPGGLLGRDSSALQLWKKDNAFQWRRWKCMARNSRLLIEAKLVSFKVPLPDPDDILRQKHAAEAKKKAANSQATGALDQCPRFGDLVSVSWVPYVRGW
jgi:hypothetical protein